MSVKYQSNGLPLSPVHSDEMLGNDTRRNEGATNLRVERGGDERERKNPAAPEIRFDPGDQKGEEGTGLANHSLFLPKVKIVKRKIGEGDWFYFSPLIFWWIPHWYPRRSRK